LLLLLLLLLQVLGHVKIGRNVTLLPTSIASHDTVVPDDYLLTPGTTSQRLPPGPAGAQLWTSALHGVKWSTQHSSAPVCYIALTPGSTSQRLPPGPAGMEI
jgi:hypothetical protein